MLQAGLAAARSVLTYARVRRLSTGPFIDPKLFSASEIDEETAQASQMALDAELANPTDHLTPLELRERRFQQYMALHVATLGEGKPERRVDRIVSHRCSPTPVGVSVFTPSTENALRGVYLHMHGGSWFLGGAAWQNDIRMLRLADTLGIAIVSVDYRLAPEHQWPACVDDCVAAAAWLAENATSEFGTAKLLIGGESAGGHLCASAMLRLRGVLGLGEAAPYPYAAANLVYGCYDMAGTPSLRNYSKPLVFNWPDFQKAIEVLLPPGKRPMIPCMPISVLSQPRPLACCLAGTDTRAPEVSPLYAPPEQLRTMPPALFSCGTDDALIDDTLFFAARWAQHAHTELALYPGGVHGVGHFGPHANTELGRKAHRTIEAFLERHLA